MSVLGPSAVFAVELRGVLADLSLDLPDGSLERLCAHYELLIRWNRRMNLTRVTEPRDAARRHYGESLLLARLMGSPDSVLDLGSGPGFPGLPIAALHIDAAVTLVESSERKAAFLREAARDWGNVGVLCDRAENLREDAEWAVSRAVRLTPDLLSGLQGRVKRLGVLCGRDSTSELAAVEGWTWEGPVELPWGERRIALLGHCST